VLDALTSQKTLVCDRVLRPWVHLSLIGAQIFVALFYLTLQIWTTVFWTLITFEFFFSFYILKDFLKKAISTGVGNDRGSHNVYIREQIDVVNRFHLKGQYTNATSLQTQEACILPGMPRLLKICGQKSLFVSWI
jgi:hypothetical protein